LVHTNKNQIRGRREIIPTPVAASIINTRKKGRKEGYRP